ncbi:MAG: anion permease [Planctomycetaceae bacterium]
MAFVAAVLMTLAFAVTNGFHDAANAIATLVSTRVAKPYTAVAVASVFNLLGPFLVGAAVAETIRSLIRVEPADQIAVIGAGLTGAVVWNVATWLRGLPASSSHALVGGLVGAAIVAGGVHDVRWEVVVTVLVALAISPLLGFAAAAALEAGSRRALRRATNDVHVPIRRGQWGTSSWLAFSHGANDAQKSVGVLVSLLIARGWQSSVQAPPWAIFACAFGLTFGTAMGGWTIVKTIGSRIVRLRPLDGLVSQAGSAAVILGASFLGWPVSTTQVVSSSVVGTGVGRGRRRHIRWQIVREIALAWVTTLPAAAVIAALSLPLWRWLP